MRPAAAIIAPTASGKSALALAVAGALNAEIISVDSGAIYLGMDIGTATPDAAALAQAPHHLINIVEPHDTYNVARFYHDARAACSAVRARGKTPLFVGGSMMYFNALFNGLAKLPPVPAEIERAARRQARERGIAALHRELQEAAPAAAARLAPADTQRVIRALCLHRIGAPAAPDKHPPLAMRRALLVPQNRDQLRARIAARLEQMWADGLEEETQGLLAGGLPPEAPPLKMAGYRQAVARAAGEYNQAVMREKARYATNQLAKRQLTWMQKWRRDSACIDPFAAADLAAQVTDMLIRKA